MQFRPCIDIHNGRVKQIVGGSLRDEGHQARENFVSDQDAAFYAELYKKHQLSGGHIILLNPRGTEEYEADLLQAQLALKAYPGGMMIGGGIDAEHAADFIRMGASHVIVTSYVFKDGQIHWDHLHAVCEAVGAAHLVIDLSCRRRGDQYFVVTDRWQKFTDVIVSEETLDMLAPFCDEFLIHAVDVEGKASGIETDLVRILAKWHKKAITYAGGISSFDDLKLLSDIGRGHIDFTIGSALDIFGGAIAFEDVCSLQKHL